MRFGAAYRYSSTGDACLRWDKTRVSRAQVCREWGREELEVFDDPKTRVPDIVPADRCSCRFG